MNNKMTNILTTLFLFLTFVIPAKIHAAADIVDDVYLADYMYGISKEKYLTDKEDNQLFVDIKDTDGNGSLTINGLKVSQSADFRLNLKTYNDQVVSFPYKFVGASGPIILYFEITKSDNTKQTFNRQFIWDTVPPIGGVNVMPSIIGKNSSYQLIVYADAEDAYSPVQSIRCTNQKNINDIPWSDINSSGQYTLMHLSSDTTLNSIPDAASFIIECQFRDSIGNISQIYETSYVVDSAAPLIYAEAIPTNSPKSRINLYGYDELSAIKKVYVSNDPLMSQDVKIFEGNPDYIEWAYDDRRVVWIDLEDTVGNRSKDNKGNGGYPVYIPNLDSTQTNNPPASTPSAGVTTIPTATPSPTKAVSNSITSKPPIDKTDYEGIQEIKQKSIENRLKESINQQSEIPTVEAENELTTNNNGSENNPIFKLLSGILLIVVFVFGYLLFSNRKSNPK